MLIAPLNCTALIIAADLTIGTYHCRNKRIYFIWDSIRTNLAVLDTGIYKKFFRIRKPGPFKINKTAFNYEKNNNGVIIERKILAQVEVFFHSKDVFTHGLIVDSLGTFTNPVHINAARNEFSINRKFGKNLNFPFDSVWGFRNLYNGEETLVNRLYGSDDSFSILIYDSLIIYRALPLSEGAKNAL